MFLSRRGKLVLACLLAVCASGIMRHWRGQAAQAAAPSVLQGAAALEQLKRDGQYESLQTAMQAARRNVNHVAHSPLGRAAWHAPNAAAGYDAYVTEAGVSLVVGQADSAGSLSHQDSAIVSLHLRSLGYGAALRAVGVGEVSGEQQAITITRDGGLREWFVNGPDGLEHGFTLNEPPQSAIRNPQSAIPLRLALQVSAGWQAIADEDGQRVILRNDAGQAIEYGKLIVRDARGLQVTARLAVVEEQVVIEVEEHEAHYPLLIDPLFTLQQRLTAADAKTADYFGYAVALDGDTALIGAPNVEGAQTDQGAAYVFVRNGAGWTQQQKLLLSDGVSNDFFGFAVALAGDTALIGAPGGDGGKGAAYLFTRSGTVWTRQPQTLSAANGFAGAKFGAALALHGQTALVGAPQQTVPPVPGRTGAAYVFVRDNANWSLQRLLLADDRADKDEFGASVALEENSALIGAPGDDVGNLLDQGSAYLFARNGATWTAQPRVNAPAATSAAGDQFGSAVAIDGDRAVVGAPGFGADDRGRAFSLVRHAAGWEVNEYILPPVDAPNAHFGAAVALDGDTLAVGASLGLTQTGADQRTAYVFSFAFEWFYVRQFGAEIGPAPGANVNDPLNDRFGYAVALDGGTVLSGAYQRSVTAIAQGAAYAFVLREGRHHEQQRPVANDGTARDEFGHAVALKGDTLAVGAWTDDAGARARQGAVYIFTRQSGGWVFQQRLTAADSAAFDTFGAALALDGDTLAVGAPYDQIGRNTAQGAVYVFTRANGVWTRQPKLTVGTGLSEDFLGGAVALEGDTLAAGAIGANGDKGAVYVFTRNGAAGWTLQPPVVAADGAPGDEFGFAVALQGKRLMVGAPRDVIGANAAQGSAYVFESTPRGWLPLPKFMADDGKAAAFFGWSVALHGELVAAGAPLDTINGKASQGSAYVFSPLGAGWYQSKVYDARDGAERDNFGAAVALSGDTLVVGARYHRPGVNGRQGAAYVFTQLDGWNLQQKLLASDGVSDDDFGVAVALSGDTIAVGADSDDLGANSNQGSVYLFASPACPALTVNPASLPNGQLGAAYEAPLSASGAPTQPVYRFTLVGGALPPGLTLLRQENKLSGTPTAAGTYRFTLKATHHLSLCFGTRAYTVTITQGGALACVSAASFLPGALASESIVAAFGNGLAGATAAATSQPLPTTLADTRVSVRDSQGAERFAPLFFVSPAQINFLLPAGTAPGTAVVTVVRAGQAVASGSSPIAPVAPGLFAANADGQGVPAAVLLRIRGNGAQSYEAVARFDGARFVALPLDFGAPTDQLVLLLYGTGLRAKQQVSAKAGGVEAEVLFAGASPGFAGLDQVNLLLPRGLAGRGDVDLALRVDGVAANTLRVNLR